MDQPFIDIYKPVYKRAVVAAAFSPRLGAVLNEAHRLLKILGTAPIIVHVGEDNLSTRSKLEQAIEKSDFKEHPPIFVIRSGQPNDVLVQVAGEYRADLIVAGALKKEGLFKYYFGSIARNLARSAPCSVMLFSDPRIKPAPLHKIHCVVDYGNHEAELADDFSAKIAHKAQNSELYLTHTFQISEWEGKKEIPNEAQTIKSIYNREDKRLGKYLEKFELGGLSVTTRCLYDKTRSVTLDFSREVKADMFIVPTQKNRMGILDRLFPQDLELALMELPCSLLLVRKSQT